MPAVLPRSHVLTRFLAAVLTLACLAFAPAEAFAQAFTDAVTVPDRAAFVERVKNHLLDDQEAEGLYTYAERSRRFQTSRGQRTLKTERVYEVYPELDGRGVYRRLVSTDSVPTSPTELAKQDRKRREQVEKALRKRAGETPRQRDQRLRDERKQRTEERAKLDEAFRLLEFRFTERTTLSGRPVIVAEFRPRAGAKATSREGRVIQKFRGRAFVSEADAQVVRVEMEALDNISFGLGVLARINKGSQAAFERRFVNGEVWLPATFRLRATGRQLLVRGIDLDAEVEWYDYRKFTVDTKETVGPVR
jgi:hypothetical protein